MKIGVAIPCYSGHHGYLQSLLENIASSTHRPDKIAISCSSWTTNGRVLGDFQGIPVEIVYSTERLNPAQNRNQAARCLTTDLISFLDADDLMHPRRLEFLVKAFEDHPDVYAVYHGYSWEPRARRSEPFWEEPEACPLSAAMVKDPKAVGIMVETTPPNLYEHHHAHVTVRDRLWKVFQFDENWAQNRKEDSVYGATLVANDVKCMYLHNKLSRYFYGP